VTLRSPSILKKIIEITSHKRLKFVHKHVVDNTRCISKAWKLERYQTARSFKVTDNGAIR